MLVMSGSPMLGAKIAVLKPTPLTLELEYWGKFWLSIGTIAASGSFCIMAT